MTVLAVLSWASVRNPGTEATTTLQDMALHDHRSTSSLNSRTIFMEIATYLDGYSRPSGVVPRVMAKYCGIVLDIWYTQANC
jgi:hypothetical protein